MLVLVGIILAIQWFIATGIVCLLIAVFFGRPIEKLGFTVCVAMYLAIAAAMWAGEFYFTEWSLLETVNQLSSLLVPSLTALALAFPIVYIIRRNNCSPWSIIAASFIPLLFGFSTGYLTAWLDANESLRFHEPWSVLYSLVAFPAGPGDMITNQIVLDGADWQGGEMGAYGDKVALWNGIAWLVICFPISAAIYFTTIKHGAHSIDKPATDGLVDLNQDPTPITL